MPRTTRIRLVLRVLARRWRGASLASGMGRYVYMRDGFTALMGLGLLDVWTVGGVLQGHYQVGYYGFVLDTTWFRCIYYYST